MEQNTTAIQREDTSGLRGFKLIKAYLAALFKTDKSFVKTLSQWGQNLAHPEIDLTTRQRRFLIEVSVLLNILTLFVLPHVLEGTIFDAHKSNESLINLCGYLLYSLFLLLPAWLFLGSFLFAPIGSLSKSPAMKYYCLAAVSLLLMPMFLTTSSAVMNACGGMFIVGSIFYEWKVGPQTETFIANVGKFDSSIREGLKRVFRIKS